MRAERVLHAHELGDSEERYSLHEERCEQAAVVPANAAVGSSGESSTCNSCCWTCGAASPAPPRLWRSDAAVLSTSAVAAACFSSAKPSRLSVESALLGVGEPGHRYEAFHRVWKIMARSMPMLSAMPSPSSGPVIGMVAEALSTPPVRFSTV